MAHLKRYMMPKAWPVAVKKEKFIIRPCPGPHPLKRCMPLQVVLRDVLGLAETASEVRKILNAGKVLVDKRPRKSPKFPVGLMDIIEMPGINKQYRVNVNEKGIFIEKIKADESGSKLCLITGKKTLKNGAEQLNLHDGRNLLVGKEKSGYRVHDSIAISLPDNKIARHYRLEKGSPAFIFSGKNVGARGTITKVKLRKSMAEKSIVSIKPHGSAHGNEIETLKDYIFTGEVSDQGK